MCLDVILKSDRDLEPMRVIEMTSNKTRIRHQTVTVKNGLKLGLTA